MIYISSSSTTVKNITTVIPSSTKQKDSKVVFIAFYTYLPLGLYSFISSKVVFQYYTHHRPAQSIDFLAFHQSRLTLPTTSKFGWANKRKRIRRDLVVNQEVPGSMVNQEVGLWKVPGSSPLPKWGEKE